MGSRSLLPILALPWLMGCSSSSGGAASATDAGPVDAGAKDAAPDAPVSPNNLSCLGQVTLDPPFKPTLTWQLEPFDPLSKATFPGIEVDLCGVDAPDCSSPQFRGMTDTTTGLAAVAVTEGTDGFTGFWEFQPTGYLQSLVFSDVPIVDDAQIAVGRAWSASDLQTVLGSVGAQWDKSKGLITFVAYDCNAALLHQGTLPTTDDAGVPVQKTTTAGVAVSVSPSAPGIVTAYLAGNTVSATAKQTDASGFGVLVNVPEGLVTVTTTLVTSSNRRVGTGQVYAKAGAISEIAMVPSP